MQKHLIRVVYPTDDGRITFRTEENWDSNIEAHSPGRTGAYVNFRFKRNGHISISNQFCSMTASGAWSRDENFLRSYAWNVRSTHLEGTPSRFRALLPGISRGKARARMLALREAHPLPIPFRETACFRIINQFEIWISLD